MDYPVGMTPAQVLAAVAVLGSALSALVAVVSAIGMARHRAPGVSLRYLATHGSSFADERNFTHDAVRHQARLLHSVGVLFAFAFVGLALNGLAAR